MKGILLALAFILASFLGQGAGPASAASLTDAQALGGIASGGGIVTIQGYGGGGGSSDGDYRRRGSDEDDDGGYRRRRGGDDDGGYRRERRRHERRGDFCRRCAWRCRDGWCPPRCWGWRRQCRDRYRD